MVTSLVFSAAIYNITSNEVGTRLTRLQSSFEMNAPFANQIDAMRVGETADASEVILLDLIFANIIILVFGGAVCYLFARRTLRPIEESHEAQSRFTSDASHELRTPLAVMKAEIEVALRDKKADSTELREVLESNLEEVEKLSALSGMLLRLSRLEHDQLNTTAVNILDATRDALKLQKNAKRVSITSSKNILAFANYPAVRELISILVDNALKYSPEKSDVSIKITLRDDKVCFEISNEGRGIPSKRLPYIFDRFYQADDSRTTSGEKGYGLGLSLAKRIVELQGGDLAVSSGEDQVTTFTVLLPIYHTTSNMD